MFFYLENEFYFEVVKWDAVLLKIAELSKLLWTVRPFWRTVFSLDTSSRYGSKLLSNCFSLSLACLAWSGLIDSFLKSKLSLGVRVLVVPYLYPEGETDE